MGNGPDYSSAEQRNQPSHAPQTDHSQPSFLSTLLSKWFQPASREDDGTTGFLSKSIFRFWKLSFVPTSSLANSLKNSVSVTIASDPRSSVFHNILIVLQLFLRLLFLTFLQLLPRYFVQGFFYILQDPQIYYFKSRTFIQEC